MTVRNFNIKLDDKLKNKVVPIMLDTNMDELQRDVEVESKNYSLQKLMDEMPSGLPITENWENMTDAGLENS